MTISQTNKTLLRDKEQLAWNGSKHITKEQLAEILTEIVSDKLRDLTNTQRDNAVEALRGFNHPSLPTNFQNGRAYVTIRANGKGHMSASEITNEIDSIRGAEVDGKIVQSLINNSIALEIDEITNTLYTADSNFFGGTKDDMTPMQAVLVAYAVVTDDMLAGNQADLTAKMQTNHLAFGSGYPSPSGQKAYGLNGYIFSTPTDFLMDDSAINKLITEIAVKSGL